MKVPTVDEQQESKSGILSPREIANEVKERREAAGMKQLTLAQLAGVTERTVQRLESGQRVDDQTLRDVAIALGLDSEAFVVTKLNPAATSPLKKYFEEMVGFDRWANEAILTWLETHPENPEMIDIFAHIVAENHPWLHVLRSEPVPADVKPQPEWTLQECLAQFGPTMDALAAFVSSLDESGFEAVVSSSSPAGLVFQHTVQEVLTNLLGHSEHHRGQIVSMIARDTGEYVPSVYMSYLRCRK